MRDAMLLLTQLRLKQIHHAADIQSAVEELRLHTTPQNEMLNTAIKLYGGEIVDPYWQGRYEAWIDEQITRSYPRLIESDRAVRAVAQRKPYPWERKK